MYNVTLREGDAVFINTGWGDLFEQFPAQNTAYNSGEPGITTAAAKWLASQKVIVVGADNWAVEVIPGEDKDIAFPVHKTLITDNGIHIIEKCAPTDRGCRRKLEPGHVLPVDDGTQGRRPDRHLRQYRGHSIAHGVAAAPLGGAGRFSPDCLLPAFSVRARAEDAAFSHRLANLDETPGVTLEGLGFTGAQVRRSFELAARSLPIDMLYFDNAGDPSAPWPTRMPRSPPTSIC